MTLTFGHRRHTRNQHGFSTLAIAFVLLALTVPIIFIAEATLVAGRQATSYALSQENLRSVDSSLSQVVGQVRLDEDAVNNGCQGPAPASGDASFDRPQERPSQGDLEIEIRCSPEPGSVSPAGRVLNFEAYVGATSPRLMGKARVKYIDMLGSSRKPGVDTLVCDWQLGADASELAPC